MAGDAPLYEPLIEANCGQCGLGQPLTRNTNTFVDVLVFKALCTPRYSPPMRPRFEE